VLALPPLQLTFTFRKKRGEQITWVFARNDKGSMREREGEREREKEREREREGERERKGVEIFPVRCERSHGQLYSADRSWIGCKSSFRVKKCTSCFNSLYNHSAFWSSINSC
jgi:hypothetical protein